MDIRNGKIIMPTIYVPTWTEMYARAGVGLRGEMEWELFERHQGKEIVVKRGKQRNLIVDAGINFWFAYAWGSTGSSARWISRCCKDYMAVGTGTAEPSVSQTSLASQLGSRKNSVSNTLAPTGTVPFYTTIVFEFQEDECNGDLTEWGLFDSNTGTNMWCRELFRDENGDLVVITKTNVQVLRFTYKLYMQRAADSSTTLLTADGTEYTCITTINNKQLENWATQPIAFYSSSNYTLVVGDSNTASDLTNDAQDAIKGTLIGKYTHSQVPGTNADYVVNSRKRSMTRQIGGSFGNGNIGEAVFASFNANAYTLKYFLRMTFNPPIPKTSSKKIWLGAEWSLTQA